MKAYLINMHLLVPRSRSSAKVEVKYKGYISQKNGRFGGIRVSQAHLVSQCFFTMFSTVISLVCQNAALCGNGLNKFPSFSASEPVMFDDSSDAESVSKDKENNDLLFKPVNTLKPKQDKKPKAEKKPAAEKKPRAPKKAAKTGK